MLFHLKNCQVFLVHPVLTHENYKTYINRKIQINMQKVKNLYN